MEGLRSVYMTEHTDVLPSAFRTFCSTPMAACVKQCNGEKEDEYLAPARVPRPPLLAAERVTGSGATSSFGACPTSLLRKHVQTVVVSLFVLRVYIVYEAARVIVAICSIDDVETNIFIITKVCNSISLNKFSEQI